LSLCPYEEKDKRAEGAERGKSLYIGTELRRPWQTKNERRKAPRPKA